MLLEGRGGVKNNIEYLLKNNRGIISKITREFLEKNKRYEYSEIHSFAREGFYKAILAYDPDKGKLSTYTYFYCRSWIRNRVKKYHVKYNKEVFFSDIDNYDSGDVTLEDSLFFKQIMDVLDDEEREILGVHISSSNKFFDSSVKAVMNNLGISRYIFNVKLEKIIDKIRNYCGTI